MSTASSEQPIVELSDAAFSYGGPPVVQHLDARLHAGQGLALIGANGSGKTTVLRGILGAVRLADGKLDVNATRLSYVPQVADLDRSFPVTAFDVVAMGVLRELRPFQPLGGKKKRVYQALEKVGLAERAHVRFGSLSGGQQQRVLLARAVVARTELILLDEPFNGLDSQNREMLLDLLEELKEEGTAIIASTHDLVLAERACDYTLIVAEQPIFGPSAEVVPLYVG